MKEGLELCLVHISYGSEISHYDHYYLDAATRTEFCSLFGLIIFPRRKPVAFLAMKHFFNGISERYKLASQKGP